MRAEFNPTGTHIQDGFLKVRIDLYPDVGDKTYQLHHIQMPVIPTEGYVGEVDKFGNPLNEQDFNNWIGSLPKVWQLNPCLCHFVIIDANTNLNLLIQLVSGIFDNDTLSQLDDLLSGGGGSLSKLMVTKCGSGSKITEQIDLDEVNSRFTSMEIKVG